MQPCKKAIRGPTEVKKNRAESVARIIFRYRKESSVEWHFMHVRGTV